MIQEVEGEEEGEGEGEGEGEVEEKWISISTVSEFKMLSSRPGKSQVSKIFFETLSFLIISNQS